ncbi:MAG: MptD family putative ECF transporter S component [Peptococcales bacterium]|jgi:energy-coupling factor transport system substrate-specific component
MNLKNVVKIAVFSIIGFVLTMGLGFATGALGVVPSLYLSCAFATILVAPVFVILCRSVKARGTAFLYFFLIGVFYTIMGMWPILIINTVAGLLAEVVIGNKDNYSTSNKRVAYAFGVGMFVYSLHAMLIVYLFSTSQSMLEMMGQEYFEFLNNFYTFKNIGICILISVIASLIGANFGNYIYNKFFSNRANKSVLK